MILVTPFWQTKPWYSQILEISMKNTVLLSIYPKLLNKILNDFSYFSQFISLFPLIVYLLSFNTKQ